MVALRPYQKSLLHQAEMALAHPRARVMLQLPTGGGKTLIASQLLGGWTRGGSKAAWLTHRRELSDQTCRVLNNTGVRATNTLEWCIDEPAPVIIGGVVILMAQTVTRRNRYEGVWEEYNPADLLVIDEAHHASAAGWQRAICQWPGRVVGLTATPWRLAKNEGFKPLFEHLILGPQINEMQAHGSLAEAQVLMPAPNELILGGIPTYNGDYGEGEIERLNEARHVWTGGALEYWQEHAGDRQTIIYAVTVHHAERLAAVFNYAGVTAAIILGSTPHEERARRIRQFSNGEMKVLVNVAVATEGFDLPDASCVVLARPTMSLSLHLQMIGRGLRPKSSGGDCLILDLAGNVERHGLPSDERQWSLEPRGSEGEGDVSPVVRCPDCEGVSPAASHDCQFCESPFGKICQRCGAWRAWKRWSAETYCGDSHDMVCNLCHPDAHKLATLPVEEGLKVMLKGELTDGQSEVNPSNLHILEDVQTRLCEVAENLVYAKKIGDMYTFDRMTEQLRPLLRREKQLKKAESEQAMEVFKDYMESFIVENKSDIEAILGENIAQIVYDFRNERMSVRVGKTEDELHTSQSYPFPLRTASP